MSTNPFAAFAFGGSSSVGSVEAVCEDSETTVDGRSDKRGPHRNKKNKERGGLKEEEEENGEGKRQRVEEVSNSTIDRIIAVLQKYDEQISAPVDDFQVFWEELKQMTTNYPFAVLCVCILGMQTKDKTTIAAAKKLISSCESGSLTPQAVASMSKEVLFEAIKTVNYNQKKVQYIVELAFRCKLRPVPNKYEDLVKLPGVGPKIATCCLQVAFDRQLSVTPAASSSQNGNAKTISSFFHANQQNDAKPTSSEVIEVDVCEHKSDSSSVRDIIVIDGDESNDGTKESAHDCTVSVSDPVFSAVPFPVSSGIVVDVHVHRVANRIGLITTASARNEASVSETKRQLEKLVPNTYHEEISVLLIKLGQTLCVKTNPKCGVCPIHKASLCKHARMKDIEDLSL